MNIFRKMTSWSKMEGDPSEIQNMLFLTLNVQRILGHQVLDPNWSLRKYLYRVILAITSISYGIIGCIAFIFSAGVGVNEKSEAFAFFMISIQAFVKLVTILHGRHNFKTLFEFNNNIFWPLIHGNAGLELVQIKKRLREVVAIQLFFFFFTFVGVVTYELSTIISYINGDRISLFKSIYTFLPNTFPYFEIGWVLQTIFGLQMAVTQICFEIVFTFNMIMGCLVVDVIVRMLRQVKNENNPMKREKALRFIHKYHVELISYLRIVHELYRVPATSQMMVALGYITALLLGTDLSQLSSFGTLIIPAVGEVVVYCWYGQEIKSQGNDLTNELIMFDWVDLDASTRKSFKLITMFMNKELRPGAVGSMDLSLNTMKLVMQHSYQNFAVLRRFKQ